MILKVRIENKGPETTGLKKAYPNLDNYITYLVGLENFLTHLTSTFGFCLNFLCIYLAV
jgi:hypothetical protein